MSARRFLIIVPYRARDLEGHALIGWMLERLGHQVSYTNGYGIERKLRERAPDALVMDHLAWTFKAEQARLAKRLGIQVFVLPTEGLFQKEDEVLEVAGALLGATGEADLYMCWGRFQQRALLRSGLLTEREAVITGAPRFDFYREPFGALSRPRDEFLRAAGFAEPTRPCLLWTTNTPYSARDTEDIVSRFVNRGGWTRERIEARVREEKMQCAEHTAVILGLAQRHPEWNVLIKVHPAEWVNPYVDLPKRAPNIRLGYDAPIREFLFAADVLLQRNCTVATEAWMLAKPVVHLEIGAFEEEARAEYLAGSTVVRDIDGAEVAVQKALAGGEVSPNQAAHRGAFIEEFYHRIDGSSASRCAAVMHERVTGPQHDADRSAGIRARAAKDLAVWKASEDRRLPNRLKDLLGVDRSRSLRVWERYTQRGRHVGGFEPEMDIDANLVAPLYERFAALGPTLPRTAGLLP